MTELEQALIEIKNEKDTKIIPSALRYGAKAFGVTGTYEAGIEPIGGENVTCLALEEIKTGDVCALVNTNGNTYEGANNRPFPASAKDGSSTKALSYYRTHQDGKYLTAYSGNYTFVFRWNGTSYEQMKVGGSYTDLQEGYCSKDGYEANMHLSVWIDNDRIYYQYISNLVVSRIDEANNNIIYETKPSSSIGSGAMLVCVHDSNVFVTKAIYSSPYSSGRCSTYQYYYNTSSKSLTGVGYITDGMYSAAKYNMYSTHEGFDFAFNDATGEMFVYCVGYNKEYSSSSASYMPRLRKFKKDSSGIYRPAATISLPALRSNQYSSGSTSGLSTPIKTPACQIGDYGQYFMALTSSDLMLYQLDTDKMTYKTIDIQFIEPDGTPLNKANISKFTLYKKDHVVAIYTSESRFASTERVRFYRLSVSEDNYWGFNFICVPYNTFFPAVPSASMPYDYPCTNPTAKSIMWSTANGLVAYELKSLPDGAAYKAYPCGNQLATNLSVGGYGIAYCDITKGDASVVSKLIEGATIIPDDYINSQISVLIGGKY